MLQVFAITYNEEVMLEFTYNFYKSRFPDLKFTIYDNMSDDKTVEIANRLGIEVISYATGGKLSDNKYLEIKNNCWKNSTCDWVCVIDCDECVSITQQELIEEEKLGTTIITTKGFNMISLEDREAKIDLNSIKHGSYAKQYSKSAMFNKNAIKNINYTHGCHTAYPQGIIRQSEKVYPLYHYKAIGEDYLVNRHLMFAKRMSAENLSNGHGIHYLNSEEDMRRDYRNAQKHEIIKLIE